MSAMSATPVTRPATVQTRIKICGITSVADALMVADAGADAIGLVFYPPSPRCVPVDIAREIALQVGPFVTVVGLFVDDTVATVEAVLDQVPLHVLQFHGNETPDYCAGFRRPYMKALRMKPWLDLGAALESYQSASAILLDAYRPGVPGGTGETFDWQRVPPHPGKPIVLAGGLNPGNVVQAVITTRPCAVDVSGGVESAPGIKDAEKVAAFIRRVKTECVE